MAATVTITGGKQLQQLFDNAGKGGVKELNVGFFQSSRYPNGTSVATVAAINEFGTAKIPERPFFRNATAKVQPKLLSILRREIDPETMVITPSIAEKLGLVFVGAIQKEIVDLKEPPNAPATIKAKQGKDNPLIDTGFLRQSVTYEVKR
jgi:hypothetical protein